MCRVENACSRGMADVEGCLAGSQFWIELKVVDAPRDTDKPLPVKFQPGQVEWLKRRHKAGAHVGLLIKVSGNARKPRTYLISGFLADIVEAGLSEAKLFQFGKLISEPEDAIVAALTL